MRRALRVDDAMAASLFEQLGGEPVLRAVIHDFVERVYADVMIGFFFHKFPKERLEAMEYELAAEFLGAGIPYSGRPLDVAHRRHPIMGGQFARRKQILREVLERHGAPATVRDAWLAHTESLRPLITGDAGSDCDPLQARHRAQSDPPEESR